MTCDECEFWTQHRVGTCSQKVLTTDNRFVNQQTQHDYGCNVGQQIDPLLSKTAVQTTKVSSPDGIIDQQFVGLKRNATYIVTIEPAP